MNELATRTLSGLLFVAIIIASLYLGGIVSFIILNTFMILGLLEFYKLFKKIDAVSPNYIIGVFGGGIISLGLTLPLLLEWENHTMLIAITPFPLLLICELYRKSVTSIQDVSSVLFSWIYITLPFFLIFAVNSLNGWKFTIGLFTIVWVNDTFAYLSGKIFGKHKLIERISPNKTWEGTFGGIFFSVLAGFIYAKCLNLDVDFWLAIALITSLAAIFGDLFQSLIKRSVRVKDTGNIIPGHGGVLDRFDAVIFAAPIFFVFTYLFYA